MDTLIKNSLFNSELLCPLLQEAFNKLLDEDVTMSKKEITENLRKAVCDLPMNTELLEKVCLFFLKDYILDFLI